MKPAGALSFADNEFYFDPLVSPLMGRRERPLWSLLVGIFRGLNESLKLLIRLTLDRVLGGV